ncbi:MAG: TIGR02099 family protein [Pseudomonadota bacterium]|nr:TIGR02099 family protein [Pseudomonadota bacterium]
MHRCVRALGWVAGVTVIVLAVLVAVTQLLLPLLARHPAWVATQLSQRWQRPVSFDSMDGRWTASGPEFVMHGVTIGAAAGQRGDTLAIPEAELKLDVGGLLLPSRHLLNLHLHGLQLDLLHNMDGWHVNGISVAGRQDRQPLSLGPSLDLWLEDLRVVVTDATLGKHYTWLAKQLRLSHQGSEIRFGGTLRREGVSAAVRTVGHFREDGSAGRIWASVESTELQPLLEGIDLDGYTADHGNGRLTAWLDWRKGQLSHSLIRFDLDSLSVSAPDGAATASVAALHGLAGIRRIDDGYDVRWSGDDGSALALRLHQPGTVHLSVGVAARELQLAPLLPWLALKPKLAPALAHWLGEGHPRGDLSQVALQWDRASGLNSLALAFNNVGIDPVGKLPGVSGLQGELRGDAEALSLELPAQPTTLQFPRQFRQPFALSRLEGTLAFWQQGGDWHLGADRLQFDGEGFAGQARGEIVLPAAGGAPVVDLYASLNPSSITAAKLFWPTESMSAATIGWLDRALVSGQLDQAQVVVRGNLADWPFRHHQGRFEGRVVLSDLDLDYGTQWPHGQGIDAVASFVNNSMLVDVDKGHSLGVKVEHAVALIPDFHDGLLDLNVQGDGSGASLLEFVRKSPIGDRQAATLAKLKLGGTGSFDLNLVLPLKKVEDLHLEGNAQLQDADLSAPDWNLKLDKLNGPLHFDAHGMAAGPLDAGFRGQPGKLQVTLAGANSDPATILSAHLQGRYTMQEMVQDYPSLDWLGQLSEGRSTFDVGFTIAHVPGSDALAQMLSVDSPLDGITLKLPAPLDKPSASTLPLHVSMSLPVAGSDLQLGLGDVVRGHLRLSDGAQKPLAGIFMFGSEMPQALPSKGLRIRGSTPTLDVTGWVQRVAAGGTGDGPGLESIDVTTDHAHWFGGQLGKLELRAVPKPDMLSVDVDGTAMTGNFSVPTSELNKRGVTARLKRLYWPRSPSGRDGEPKSAAVSGPAKEEKDVAVPDPADTGINPSALPPFHLWIGDLRLGDAKLGEARLETWPTAKGMHIEQLRALSSQVQINASGDWDGTASNSQTHMRINFAAEDLGAMLGAFGFDGLVNGGKTIDLLDARWPGAPSGLSLATMNGTLSIDVKDGRIPEAGSPGVGRLLGLVSLAELPRRLTLDFGDVFGKGLAFDSIEGDFHLANGNATTDNLVIAGPSANISVTGRTGLKAKDYDQEMRVVPHVGNSLPLVGAVVGGPIGAAAGFAVQGLLGKGLNKAASARYRITGSWGKPVMTLLEKHGPKPAPAPPPLDPGKALPVPAGSVQGAPAGSSQQPH